MARWFTTLSAGLLVASFAVAPALARPGEANAAGPAGSSPTATPVAAQPSSPRATVVYRHLDLPGGKWATVYSDGLAEVHTADDRHTMITWVPGLNVDGATATDRKLPGKGQLIMDLARGESVPYAPQQVLVALQTGVTAPAQQSVSPRTLGQGRAPHDYTSAPGLNKVLAGLGTDRMTRSFRQVPQQSLADWHRKAQAATGRSLVDISRLYVVHITHGSVTQAVDRLRADSSVAYAGPNWIASTSNTDPVPVPAATVLRSRTAASAATSVTDSKTGTRAGSDAATATTAATGTGTSAAPDGAADAALPTNVTLTSSAQSLLNRPAVNAVPAFSILAQHGQLPGQGEIITNVSLGDLTDASAAANPDDPCHFYAGAYGPTTIVQDGQRYIDWPSMPLIPTYTSSSADVLDPTGETCGQDPNLVEVGLDFSMMAPLPDADQRPGRTGSGLTDLLGIAPGAQYRLVVPHTPGGAISDVDAAFLAAANQQPAPDVITASLGFGMDQYGFASRYLEEDPVTESVIASIVHGKHIVVCVSAGDGLRTFTNAPVPPSGGSVATNTAPPGQQQTDLNDVAFSSAVSRVYDSGAIDVGGSTLNDIFSAPPDDPRNASLRSQQAFPATRYNGARNYSSGFGSRVNVSAPGDNVLMLSHPFGGDAQSVQLSTNGGTSASAPEVAAAAAVVLQVARLTHNTKVVGHPLAVRGLLAGTGTPLPAVPQSDLPIDVGPQIDLGAAVESLYAAAGSPVDPGVARVAVAQRQAASALGGSFYTATDPTQISLTGRLAQSLITVSPDWLGLSGASGATYRLAADADPGSVLATTPWARLLPAEILGAAGQPLASDQLRTVPLTYTASISGTVVATAHVSLTFGPTDGTVQSAQAPIVDPVVHGSTLRVQYDLTGLTGATNPTLVVSNPGRVESATGLYFRPAYTVPLTSPTGTVSIPVSALPGGGIYGVGVQDSPGGWFSRNDSTFAFTRIAPTGDRQPPVPLLSSAGWAPGHYAELPYHGTFTVSWDVHQVPQATNAVIEISAPGRTVFHSYNPFNNPNGSERDANGHDSGSVAYLPVTGRTGSITLDGAQVGLVPTMNQVVRVLATDRAGHVVGEASGVSTIAMDGVRAADGGNVAGGFGVNADGTDGFLTSNQTASDGANLGSVETFDQASAAITGTPRSSGDYYNTLFGGCPGLYHGDAGLFEDYNPGTGDDTYRLLHPASSGTDGGTWTPPDSAGTVICGTTNQAAPDSAFLAGTGGTQPKLSVFGSNVAANTFDTPIDISGQVTPGSLAIVGGIGQDSETDQAVVPVINAFAPNSPGQIILANLSTGETSQFASVTTYFASGVAVDSSTHRAIVPSNDTFGIYDLTTKTGTAESLGGGGYQHPAADPSRSLFVLQEVASPDFSGEAPNNNTMSSIVVVDGNGNLVRRIESFNFYDTYLLDMGAYVQLNPGTGRGFTLAYGAAQLQPFSYAGD
jgi:hypothetical protein